jgi:hypothetical protein
MPDQSLGFCLPSQLSSKLLSSAHLTFSSLTRRQSTHSHSFYTTTTLCNTTDMQLTISSVLLSVLLASAVSAAPLEASKNKMQMNGNAGKAAAKSAVGAAYCTRQTRLHLFSLLTFVLFFSYHQ